MTKIKFSNFSLPAKPIAPRVCGCGLGVPDRTPGHVQGGGQPRLLRGAGGREGGQNGGGWREYRRGFGGKRRGAPRATVQPLPIRSSGQGSCWAE